MMDPKQLSKLKFSRLVFGLTQRELAARAGVHPVSFSRWETGTWSPSHETKDKIAAAIGLSVDQLFPESPEENGHG